MDLNLQLVCPHCSKQFSRAYLNCDVCKSVKLCLNPEYNILQYYHSKQYTDTINK